VSLKELPDDGEMQKLLEDLRTNLRINLMAYIS
jgi:hypothetical protein